MVSTKKTTKKTASKSSDMPVQQMVVIEKLNLQIMTITLESDSSLICHRWSDKAKKEMLNKQMKKAAKAKEAKDPKKDYEESLYPYPGGGHGFPAIAFKAAAVDACSQVSGITKVMARGAFHIDEELIKINGKPSMRSDMVRIGMGTADIRYRGEFKKWSVILPIRFNANAISAEQIVNLFEIAGFAVGIGEWRPQKNGSYGMFHVKKR